jgi:hypothetical protein
VYINTGHGPKVPAYEESSSTKPHDGDMLPNKPSNFHPPDAGFYRKRVYGYKLSVLIAAIDIPVGVWI